MKFIDLFAGLGGFTIALTKHNMQCVFASEIDEKLRLLYERNFNTPCTGDIKKIPVSEIPTHDILCAGFPCQPFSKAGKQQGLEDINRGDLIFNIIKILQYHRPSYFILENVPNIKSHQEGKTWVKIIELLKQCNYKVNDYILSPHQFGVPHRRDRIFIIGQLHKLKPITFDFMILNKEPILKTFLKKPEKQLIKKLSALQIECLDTWQEFITSIPKKIKIPTFPIWSMEFGANYPLNGITPFYMSQEELSKYNGAFGKPLKDLNKEEQLASLPIYSIYNEEFFPKWKINYIQKNRDFWHKNKKYISKFIPRLKKFINSWQKFEWNVGDSERNVYKYILQFRSSGIRIKNNSSFPSLVLTGTQTPIIGWEKRYLSLYEAQLLQGFESISLDLPDNMAIQALGNAVNTKVVEEIAKQIAYANQNKYAQKHNFSLATTF